jgi:thiol:disulfide interchange protein DsbD
MPGSEILILSPRPRGRFFPFLPAFALALWLLPWLPAFGLNAEDLLPAEEAFRVSGRMEPERAIVSWKIADGYYLYRKKFKFVAKTPGVTLGEAEFPKGQIKQDEFFGEMEIFHGRGEARLPASRSDPATANLALEVTVQGCADAGVCYPPFKQTLNLDWPRAAGPGAGKASAGAADLLGALGLKPGAKGADDLLPPDEAFRFFAEVKNPETVRVSWQIADGYYLYREKFRFGLHDGDGIKLKPHAVPRGEPRHDEEFGDVEILRGEVGFDLPLARAEKLPAKVRLEAGFQGCADRGVCYPPMAKTVSLELPAAGSATSAAAAALPAAAAPPAQASAPDAPAGEPAAAFSPDCEIGPPNGFVETPPSEQCEIAGGLQRESIWVTAASFLGMGLLLAFTPCMFPMIPILSGIIVGHGHRLTTRRAFSLSLSYVVASALAYTLFGVLAGLFGSNLQALFQDTRVIVAFSALFVVLALSMFDVFTFQMPAFVQSRLTVLSNRQEGGTLAGAAVMGALSALIMGPCVAAPLAGALIYIGQTGDAVLGGVALFALGMGMGLPLLVIGTSAGKLLPRAGTWMNAVKAAFGVGLLGIAVWLLERILPSAASMFLWALLLIIPAIFLGALDTLPQPASGWRKLWKGVGIVMLAYGVLLLIGVASDSNDPLQPLRRLASESGAPAAASLEFRTVRSVPELNREIAEAESSGRWAMLDFYADWCVSCKEMERYTFADPKVQETLRGMVLLKADVTANSEADQVLLRQFRLIGPPATLFFGPDRGERRAHRVVGFMDAEKFVNHIDKVIRQ